MGELDPGREPMWARGLTNLRDRWIPVPLSSPLLAKQWVLQPRLRVHRRPTSTGFLDKPPHCKAPAETRNSLSRPVCLQTSALHEFRHCRGSVNPDLDSSVRVINPAPSRPRSDARDSPLCPPARTAPLQAPQRRQPTRRRCRRLCWRLVPRAADRDGRPLLRGHARRADQGHPFGGSAQSLQINDGSRALLAAAAERP